MLLGFFISINEDLRLRVISFLLITLSTPIYLSPERSDEYVSILLMVSSVSNIGIADLTRKANELVTTTYRPLEIYTFLIFEYLVLILIVSYFVRKLENKLEYK